MTREELIEAALGGRVTDDEIRDLLALAYRSAMAALPKRHRPGTAGPP